MKYNYYKSILNILTDFEYLLNSPKSINRNNILFIKDKINNLLNKLTVNSDDNSKI